MKLTKRKDLSRLGDIAEHYAITYLWDQGFDVFKNSGCTGPVDMIALDREGGNMMLIDVKTGLRDYRYPNALCNRSIRTPLQKQLGVQILTFNPENRKLHFVGHKV